MLVQMETSTRRKHFLVLDWLRAVAALGVFAHHFFQQHAEHFSSPTPRALLNHLGVWGVAIFFVLSGFCVHWGSLQSAGGVRHFSALDYACRRGFRIYPAFIVCVLLSYGLGHLRESHLIHPADPLAILAHLSLLSHFSVAHRDAINNVLWSIVVELYFYILYGLLASRFDGLRKTLDMTVLALAVGAATYVASITLLPPGDLRVLVQKLFLASWWTWCLGALVAELIHNQRWQVWSAPLNRLAIAACLAATLGLGLLPGSWGLQAQRFVLPFAAAALLYFALQDPGRHERFPRLVKLGLMSYSLYLFHPVAIWLGLQTGPDFAVTTAVTFLSGWMLAHGGHRWIEQPMVKLGKNISSLGTRLPELPRSCHIAFRQWRDDSRRQ